LFIKKHKNIRKNTEKGAKNIKIMLAFVFCGCYCKDKIIDYKEKGKHVKRKNDQQNRKSKRNEARNNNGLARCAGKDSN
jgi:hypothetical protein